MRVIGGRLGSRVLKSLPGLDTRPTPDRLRESLFNILSPRIEGALFVDAYAGTGAVGIEALSRGASRVVFLERAKGALSVLRENLKSLGVVQDAEVVAGKAAALLNKYAPSAQIVFLDPPYEQEREYLACMEILSEAPPELVIVQHPIRFTVGEQWPGLKQLRVVRQGDNALTFFERNLPGM